MYRKVSVFLAAVFLIHAVQCIVVNAEETTDVQASKIDGTGTEEAMPDELSNGELETVPEDMIYQVSFPADIHAFLDPGDLSGKGQIFSSRYVVENYGNTDIDIVISGIDVYYASEEDVYEFSEEPVTDYHGRAKKMNIDMVWENESGQTETVLHISEGIKSEYVLSLKASEYGDNNEFVRLCDGSRGGFYFTGTLNANPDLIWEEGEIIVQFDYQILNRQECTQTEDVQSSKMSEAPREDAEPEEKPEKRGDQTEDSMSLENTEQVEKEEDSENEDKTVEETQEGKKETENQELPEENEEDIQNGEQQEVPNDMEDMTDHENCAEKTGSEQDQTAGEDT